MKKYSVYDIRDSDLIITNCSFEDLKNKHLAHLDDFIDNGGEGLGRIECCKARAYGQMIRSLKEDNENDIQILKDAFKSYDKRFKECV